MLFQFELHFNFKLFTWPRQIIRTRSTMPWQRRGIKVLRTLFNFSISKSYFLFPVVSFSLTFISMLTSNVAEAGYKETLTLCKKYPNTQFFLVRIFWTEYWKLRTRKNSIFGHFWRNVTNNMAKESHEKY